MANPDQQFRSQTVTPTMSPEQEEPKLVLFEILISLFERAYLLAYEPDMRSKQMRRWLSREDYMRAWCAREDFREMLPKLLVGEDPNFGAYISHIAKTVTFSPVSI